MEKILDTEVMEPVLTFEPFEEVKEEVKADAPASSGEGDKSTESPKTGESVASVAAIAALMGAAFVIARKAKK